MKTVSILIPTYNEEGNIIPIYEDIREIFQTKLSKYKYEIVFIDNHSTDATQQLIVDLCAKDKDVKAIFNTRNMGFARSTFYGLTQLTGDCGVMVFADRQDPPALILQFVEEWEKGNKIVIGVKNKSQEHKLMYFIRSCYYKLIAKIGDIEHIEHFTGFGLYDRDFLDVLKTLDDSTPYLRGIVAELGYQWVTINYTQKKRESGKSKFNLLRMYDLAMQGITSYTRSLLRLATFMSFVVAVISVLVAIVSFILKLINWNSYPVGTTAVICGIFFIGAMQLFFIGLVGEYVMAVNTRSLKRPLVVEERRINF